ncbi:hypothetical protein WJX74_009113 [Apatococcus lobatus]|uniref:Uncharacterized protein n=2 Tax=Apatococcus TaxID=904362 RepID=A0AAW1SFW7_9CHLO
MARSVTQPDRVLWVQPTSVALRVKSRSHPWLIAASLKILCRASKQPSAGCSDFNSTGSRISQHHSQTPQELLQLAAVSTSPPPGRHGLQNLPYMLLALIAVQSVALGGAIFTGSLARERRLKLEQLNIKLRQVNAELIKRHSQAEGAEQQSEASEAEQQAQSLAAARATLSSSLDAPAAAHPFESYGKGGLSLAQARRRLSGLLQAGRGMLRDGQPEQALQMLVEADSIAQELLDHRARRAILRVRAQGLQQMEQFQAALDCLQESLDLSLLSSIAGEDRDKADIYGTMADLLTDLGQFEEAAKFYDKCCQAIQDT